MESLEELFGLSPTRQLSNCIERYRRLLPTVEINKKTFAVALMSVFIVSGGMANAQRRPLVQTICHPSDDHVGLHEVPFNIGENSGQRKYRLYLSDIRSYAEVRGFQKDCFLSIRSDGEGFKQRERLESGIAPPEIEDAPFALRAKRHLLRKLEDCERESELLSEGSGSRIADGISSSAVESRSKTSECSLNLQLHAVGIVLIESTRKWGFIVIADRVFWGELK